MADIEKTIKNAVESNKTLMGSDETLRALMADELSLVVMASNCPQEVAEKIEHYAQISGTESHKFSLASKELGSVCRKPFSVTVLGITK